MRQLSTLTLLATLAACSAASDPDKSSDRPTDTTDGTDVIDTDTTDTDQPPADLDGDGFDSSVDCDDTLSSVFPGADEQAGDGIDQDCDGVDLCYVDRDGDGVGIDEIVTGTTLACDGAGESALATDCDDAAATVWPGNREWCDGLDNDCDTAIDPLCLQLDNADTLWTVPPTGIGYYPQDLALGDFDWDGVDELAIGGVLTDIVYVSDGAPLGASDFDTSLLTQLSSGDFTNFFGFTLDKGDTNGDGHPDLLVGAPFVEHEGSGITNGSLYIYTDLGSAPDNAGPADASGEITADPAMSALSVWQAAAVGDFDGDGNNDVVTGIVDDYNPASRIYVMQGPIVGSVSVLDAMATIDEGTVNASFGYCWAAGDFDGDGIDDLVVPSPNNSVAYLFSGPLSGALDIYDATAIFIGAPADGLGTVVTTGDYNGDGMLDIAIGGEDANGGNGILYVAHGPFSGAIDLTVSASFTMNASGSWPRLSDLETKITSADVDGDGTDDLILGAPGVEPGGIAAIVFGPNLDGRYGDFNVEQADVIIAGVDSELAGFNVEWGDLDGDGQGDLVVGAYLGSRIGVFYGPITP